MRRRKYPSVGRQLSKYDLECQGRKYPELTGEHGQILWGRLGVQPEDPEKAPWKPCPPYTGAYRMVPEKALSQPGTVVESSKPRELLSQVVTSEDRRRGGEPEPVASEEWKCPVKTSKMKTFLITGAQIRTLQEGKPKEYRHLWGEKRREWRLLHSDWHKLYPGERTCPWAE